MRCGAVLAWRGVGMLWHDVAWRGVMWRGVAGCGVASRGVAWHFLSWRGVEWGWVGLGQDSWWVGCHEVALHSVVSIGVGLSDTPSAFH